MDLKCVNGGLGDFVGLSPLLFSSPTLFPVNNGGTCLVMLESHPREHNSLVSKSKETKGV